MKVLFPVISLSKSGGFKVLTQLANYGLKLGHQVEFVCPYTIEEPYYKNDFKVIKIDINGDEVFQSGADLKPLSGIIKVIALWRFLKKNSVKYDAVVANSNLTAYPVLLGSKADNFYYIQAYEPEFCKEYKGFIKRYGLMFVAWLTYYFPLTKIVNAEIYKNYKNIKTNYVVPPGLDLEIFYPKENDYLNDKHEWTVGCIGRIEEWKGSGDVTKAISILHKKGYEIKYRVAFNPVDYDIYELVKPDGHLELADFYRSLDIMVAPGHIQLGAIHYPVLESMACGVPVITTGYYPANEDNAYIVDVRNPEDIANKVIEIIDEPDLLNKRIKHAVKDIANFSWVNVSGKFYTILVSGSKASE